MANKERQQNTYLLFCDASHFGFNQLACDIT